MDICSATGREARISILYAFQWPSFGIPVGIQHGYHKSLIDTIGFRNFLGSEWIEIATIVVALWYLLRWHSALVAIPQPCCGLFEFNGLFSKNKTTVCVCVACSSPVMKQRMKEPYHQRAFPERLGHSSLHFGCLLSFFLYLEYNLERERIPKLQVGHHSSPVQSPPSPMANLWNVLFISFKICWERFNHMVLHGCFSKVLSLEATTTCACPCLSGRCCKSTIGTEAAYFAKELESTFLHELAR